MTGGEDLCRAAAWFLVAILAGCNSSQKMTFFVTSIPTGDGGNLGGLAGADAHCQRLATAAGSTKHWRAYLSTTADAEHGDVNARDRIGRGPWFNAKGMQVASSVEDLHGPGNRLGGRTSVDEHGNFILAGVHDILTGSNADGTVATGDATCRNWTSTAGHAMVGHSNKVGSIAAIARHRGTPRTGRTAAACRRFGSSGAGRCSIALWRSETLVCSWRESDAAATDTTFRRGRRADERNYRAPRALNPAASSLSG